jgi:hypothetical protein
MWKEAAVAPSRHLPGGTKKRGTSGIHFREAWSYVAHENAINILNIDRKAVSGPSRHSPRFVSITRNIETPHFL